jgi:hypothetical protein
MTSEVCLTVDVEDWYDGMAILGHSFQRPSGSSSGLSVLTALLKEHKASSRVTLFVVGNYAASVNGELASLADRGHEIASHGPDHGRLPEDPSGLVNWLRAGRVMVEDLVQVPVRGFRSPRFDFPRALGLARFREQVAEAGFEYVSDVHCMGSGSPIRELPLLSRHGMAMGRGGYQRFLPASVLSAAISSTVGPAVMYFHSYDFSGELPGLGSVRSVAVARQLLFRKRTEGAFAKILDRHGSRTCGYVQS